MKHLSAEDIVNYVTMDAMNETSLGVCKNVNGHIRGCTACLEKLRKYLNIHDVYKTENPGGDFKVFATELLQEESLFTMDMN